MCLWCYGAGCIARWLKLALFPGPPMLTTDPTVVPLFSCSVNRSVSLYFTCSDRPCVSVSTLPGWFILCSVRSHLPTASHCLFPLTGTFSACYSWLWPSPCGLLSTTRSALSPSESVLPDCAAESWPRNPARTLLDDPRVRMDPRSGAKPK